MKLTLNELLNSHDALTVLGNARGISSKIAYRIAKNIKPISQEIEIYHETRIKLLEEHSNKDDEGKPIIKGNEYDIMDGHREIVEKEINELKNEEVEIDIKKVTLDDIDVAKLSPLQIQSLEYMIDLTEE